MFVLYYYLILFGVSDDKIEYFVPGNLKGFARYSFIFSSGLKRAVNLDEISKG